jgi:thymidylate synthase
MSYIRYDEQYRNLARAILSNGTKVIGRNNLEYTQVFGQDFTVDLRQEFPALTLRRMPLKNLFREFMWDVRGESHISSLGKAAHFWDFLAIEDYLPGSYGASWRSWPVNQPNISEERLHESFRHKPYDQLKFIHSELKSNPTNRQLVLTTLNPAFKPEIAKCPPCHPSVIFSSDGTHLDVLVTCRSNDLSVGQPLDCFRYSLLCTKMAQDSGLVPRFVKFSSANNHIYTKNLEEIRTLVSREPKEAIPSIWINPEKSLFELDPETDFRLDNYQSHPPIKFDVAK